MRRTRKGGHPGLTMKAIADQLNSEGVPTSWEAVDTGQIVNFAQEIVGQYRKEEVGYRPREDNGARSIIRGND